MSRIRAHLSFANVVSLLALFVALGGTSYAALTITGKNVKNGSLTGADIKNSSLSSLDVKDGSLLARDFKLGQLPSGPPGPQGVAGPAGPKGDSGATHLTVRTSSGHGMQRTDCQPGEVATGGGGHSPDGYVVASAPTGHPTALFAPNSAAASYNASTSWESRAVKVNISNTGTVTSVEDADVTTWAVCAAP